MAQKQNSAPESFSFEDAAASPDSFSFEDAQDGGAQRGVAPSAPGTPPSTPAIPGALDRYLTTVGKNVFEIPRYVGEGQQRDVEAFTRAPPQDIPGELLDTLTRAPRQVGATLSFLGRPIFGTAEKAISGLSGEFFSPEAAGTALMGLKGTPEARWFPREGPMKDVTPRAPPGSPRLPSAPPGPSGKAVATVPPPAPMAPIGPTINAVPPIGVPPAAVITPRPPGEPAQRTVPRDVSGDLTKYSSAANKGQIATLDKKIARAEEALREFGATPSGDPKIEINLRDKLTQWKSEREALAGLGEEIPGQQVAVTPPKKVRGKKTTAPKSFTFEEAIPATVPAEKIQSSAVRMDGKIYTGQTHVDALEVMAKATGKTEDELFDAFSRDPSSQGFVTSTGRYVDRNEAATIAKGAKQSEPLPPGPGVDPNELISAQLRKPPPTIPPSGAPPGPTTPPAVPPTTPPGTPPPPIPPASPAYRPTALETIQRHVKNLEKVLSPTTVDDMSQLAEAVHRAEYGTAAREVAQAEHSMQQYRQAVGKLTEPQRYDFIAEIEGTAPRAPVHAALQPLARTMQAGFAKVRLDLENLPMYEKARFRDEYFPHLWADDPKTVEEFYNTHGIGKEGGGGFIKGRSLPTIADGLAAGLRLKNSNPIAAYMDYMTNAKRFVAQARVFDYGRTHDAGGRVVKPGRGLIKLYTPAKNPAGTKELAGRFSGKLTAVGQQRYYAPEGFALIYNNAISPKFQGAHGELANAFLRASNFLTATELGLSPFHAVTMSNEAMVNGVTEAIIESVDALYNATTLKPKLSAGSVLRGTAALGKAVTNPVRYAMTGGKMQRAYVGSLPVTPDTAHIYKIVDLLEKAGGRAIKIDMDYLAAQHGSFVSAWKNSALKGEIADYLHDIRTRPFAGTVRTITNVVARALDTVSAPMFQEWIPRLKLGAFEENMSGWLKRNLGASQEEQVKAAREIWDSIDNRFGEMVKDNIFWKNTQKQVAQGWLRSFTWTFGSSREVGGGGWDVGKGIWKGTQALGKKLGGQNVQPKDLPRFTQRIAYSIALPLTASMLGAVALYLFTGERPKSLNDVFAPRTGGKVAKGAPERFLIPGYMKDVFGWYKSPIHEMYNKTATLPRMAFDLVMNRDWKDQPIVPDAEFWSPNVGRRAGYVGENIGPFGIRNVLEGQPKGSKLPPVMTFMGFNQAGSYFTNPKRYEKNEERFSKKDWKRKEHGDKRERAKYLGPD